VDLRQLRERQERHAGPVAASAPVSASRACAARSRVRPTCGAPRRVGSVDFRASTSYRRIAAAQGTMITAEKCDVDVTMAPSDDDQKRIEQSYLRYTGAGLEFFAGIAVLTIIGVWLDGRFGTSPVLTIVFAFVGFAASTWNLVRSVFPSERPARKQDDQP
jgi:ATP synthase protein I